MQGKWRKEPFAPRKYERLTEYVSTKNVSAKEGIELRKSLETPLVGYLGQAYNYDDHGLTEEWMVSFSNKKQKASDDDVIRTQVESLLDILLAQVQDRICTESGVLDKTPLNLGSCLLEKPVWGMDSYTRRMVEMCIEDRVPCTRFDAKLMRKFIEKLLLPSINRQLPAEAHNITYALRSILVV